jgi:hypothetical protein
MDSHIVIEVSRSSLCLFSLELPFDSKESIQCVFFVLFNSKNSWLRDCSSSLVRRSGSGVGVKCGYSPICFVCVTLQLKHFLCKKENLEKQFKTDCIAVHDSDWFHKGFCMRGGRLRPKILISYDQISSSEKGNIHLYAVVRDRNTVDTTVVMFK